VLEDRDLKSVQMARNLIKKAKKAQKKLAKYSQDEIDELVFELAEAARKRARELAELAVEDTGMGIVEDKVSKNFLASVDLWEYIKDMKTVGIISEDKEKMITEVASPMGVITALVPSTNPTSTVIYKALISLKSANAVIFSPHPSARECIKKTVEILNDRLEELGAPDGLVGCLDLVSLEGTEELMTHQDVSLILATGGSAMVSAAYSSGTPALGVGPGNVPVFIERSADLEKAVNNLTAAGYAKKDLEAYVLMGLPHQPLEEVYQSILFVNSLGIKVSLASYSPIPGTVDYRRAVSDGPVFHATVVDGDLLDGAARGPHAALGAPAFKGGTGRGGAGDRIAGAVTGQPG